MKLNLLLLLQSIAEMTLQTGFKKAICTIGCIVHQFTYYQHDYINFSLRSEKSIRKNIINSRIPNHD